LPIVVSTVLNRNSRATSLERLLSLTSEAGLEKNKKMESAFLPSRSKNFLTLSVQPGVNIMNLEMPQEESCKRRCGAAKVEQARRKTTLNARSRSSNPIMGYKSRSV